MRYTFRDVCSPKRVDSDESIFYRLAPKIVDVYEDEPISQRQLAKRFCVATSFIIKLLKQYRETGSIEPKPHGGGKPAQLTLEHHQVIAELVEATNDATLAQLSEQFEAKVGMRVSRSTLGRAVRRLKLTVKKLFERLNETANRFNRHESSFGN